MSITPAGYIFFTVLALAITLSVLVTKRLSRETGKPNGCMAGAYIGTIVVAVTTLFVGSVFMFSAQIYKVATYPKYEATIVDVNSEWVERDYQDDDGFTRSETIEMHTAVLEFYDHNNQLIRLNNNIRSGGKPTIGEQITIAYRDGVLSEVSLRSLLMYIGLATMMILLGTISACMLLYAFNKNTERVQVFGWSFVFYFVIPAGLIFMLGGMLYALWDHYTNNGDMPIWAQGVAIFFSVVILLVLFAGITNKIRGTQQK